VPELSEPRLEFVAGTVRVPASRVACGEDPPTDGALIWLFETVEPLPPGYPSPTISYPPQPTRFRLGPPHGDMKCASLPSHDLIFQSIGRHFYFKVILGDHAGQKMTQRVLDVISSFRASPLT